MKRLITLLILSLIILVEFDIDQIKGTSMQPIYNSDEKVISASKLRYSKGDVIIFNYQGNQKEKHIKRIIASPGDTIGVQNGYLTVNGELTSIPSEAFNQSFTLRKNEYFVVGDNYNNSFDSRNHGPINENDIQGKVFFSGC